MALSIREFSLSTVQSAVNDTLVSNTESKAQHQKLNEQLQQHLDGMVNSLNESNSLADIKKDINDKLTVIATTITEKSQLENKQQQLLEQQLNSMSQQVESLSQQSKNFEKQLKEQQAKNMQDALTKLNNRAAFDDYFAKQMVRFHRKPFELALTVIDIDDFKRINDTFGHSAGDKTLQVIANTLKKQLGKSAFIGRYGGEEFVLIYSKQDKKTVLESLDNVRLKIAKLPFKFKNTKVSITLSMGITYIKESDNVHIAFERADTALYQAKENGKNTVVYI